MLGDVKGKSQHLSGDVRLQFVFQFILLEHLKLFDMSAQSYRVTATIEGVTSGYTIGLVVSACRHMT